MATIKRNGAKVVLKDGKVACGCCDEPGQCDELFCERTDIDLNIFEITREEYLNYKNGGVWNILSVINYDYYGYDADQSYYISTTITGGGEEETNIEALGCYHYIEQSGSYLKTTVIETIDGPIVIEQEGSLAGILIVRLKKINTKYYVQYFALLDAISSTNFFCSAAIPNENTNPLLGTYPVNRSIIVDANNISSYGYFLPQNEYFTDNTSISLTATFTPNEL